MNRFFIFLMGAVGVFIFSISQIYGDDVTPAVRNTLMVGGIGLFAGSWILQIAGQVLGFARAAKRAKGAFAQAKKLQARQVAARSPLKNFLLSLLFVGVAAGFLALGIFAHIGWVTIVHRVIWIALSGAFLVIGFVTAVYHFRNMLRK